jgi:hypothetical protein
VDAKSVKVEILLLKLTIFWIEHAIVDNIEYFLNKFWWKLWNYWVEYSIKTPKKTSKRTLRMGRMALIILCAPHSRASRCIQEPLGAYKSPRAHTRAPRGIKEPQGAYGIHGAHIQA